MAAGGRAARCSDQRRARRPAQDPLRGARQRVAHLDRPRVRRPRRRLPAVHAGYPRLSWPCTAAAALRLLSAGRDDCGLQHGDVGRAASWAEDRGWVRHERRPSSGAGTVGRLRGSLTVSGSSRCRLAWGALGRLLGSRLIVGIHGGRAGRVLLYRGDTGQSGTTCLVVLAGSDDLAVSGKSSGTRRWTSSSQTCRAWRVPSSRSVAPGCTREDPRHAVRAG